MELELGNEWSRAGVEIVDIRGRFISTHSHDIVLEWEIMVRGLHRGRGVFLREEAGRGILKQGGSSSERRLDGGSSSERRLDGGSSSERRLDGGSSSESDMMFETTMRFIREEADV